MKIKRGFISNSSSTSFIFLFKTDDVDQCKQILEKYKDYFTLTDYQFFDKKLKKTCVSINGDEVVDSMKKFMIELKDIDELIEKYKQMQKFLAEFGDEFIECLRKIGLLEDLKSYGFKSVFVINFGDNHGDVSGGVLGYVMDYVGRNIFLSKDDVYLYTEQER